MATTVDDKGFWKGLPPMVKLGVVVALVATGYLVYRKLKSDGVIGTQGTVDNREYAKDVDEERKKIAEMGIKPTLSKTQVQDVTNALHRSMDGYNPATREDTHIPDFKKAVYRIVNAADLYAIIDSFKVMKGSNLQDWVIREYESPTGGGGITTGIYSDMSLPRDIFNKHLKSQGIKYRF